MPNKPALPAKPIVLELSPAEHGLVLKAAETGLAVIEALHLVQNTVAMELAVRKVRGVKPAR